MWNVEKNPIKAISEKAGSKKLFCQTVVQKQRFVHQNNIAEFLSLLKYTVF